MKPLRSARMEYVMLGTASDSKNIIVQVVLQKYLIFTSFKSYTDIRLLVFE
jgi:hypothetical protein